MTPVPSPDIRLTLRLPAVQPPQTEVIIGAGTLDRIGPLLRPWCKADRAVLVCDAALPAEFADRVRSSLEGAGFAHVSAMSLRADERAKSLDSLSGVFAHLLEARADRRTPLIALGGGIVGDVAGFAAATWMRGMPLVLCPTTLLSMVDACLGGKTGVNFRNASTGDLLKNMVGVFHPAQQVIIDVRTLRSLPPREFAAGLAECVKHGILADAGLLDRLEQGEEALRGDEIALCALVEDNLRIKAAIVEADFREEGARALLNLGHTFAHAVEAVCHGRYLHGEAVAIGLVAATRCAVALGMCEVFHVEHLERLLTRLGLPIRVRGVEIAALRAAMTHDKKAGAGRLRLVLPRAVGRVEIVENPDESAVMEAWRGVVETA